MRLHQIRILISVAHERMDALGLPPEEAKFRTAWIDLDRVDMVFKAKKDEDSSGKLNGGEAVICVSGVEWQTDIPLESFLQIWSGEV